MEKCEPEEKRQSCELPLPAGLPLKSVRILLTNVRPSSGAVAIYSHPSSAEALLLDRSTPAGSIETESTRVYVECLDGTTAYELACLSWTCTDGTAGRATHRP
jgi:hypothetical protein